MKLYIVHCGFYDADLCDGIYEGHVNLFVAAESFEEAKSSVRKDVEFKKRKMHIDGLQEIELVSGYRVQMIHDKSREHNTVLNSNLRRDL